MWKSFSKDGKSIQLEVCSYNHHHGVMNRGYAFLNSFDSIGCWSVLACIDLWGIKVFSDIDASQQKQDIVKD